MATTDTKPGFRLPWSSDRTDAPESDAAMPEATTDAQTTQELETTEMIDAAATTDTEAAVDARSADTVAAPAASAAPTGRKPNKFMADLTKAMQAAAESARGDVLERLNADAKVTIEKIHADSATEATELRKQADDDVAGIREWSKTEIARIREETDERITHRKERLEREIESHAAEIEGRIERVQGKVNAFEGEMGSFFERLLAEDDPTRFAAMAESLPEPPSFEADTPYVATVAADVETPAEAPAPPEVEAPAAEAVVEAPVAEVEPVVAEVEAPAPEPEPVVEAQAEPAVEPEPATGGPWADEGTIVAHAAPAETPTEDAGDLFSIAADEPTADADDPRLSMLGLTPDFAAAEAEAATFDAGEATGDEAASELADEAIAARIAGLVPDGEAAPTGTTTTRVSVVGLVSVASIAGFKRHLSRATGVTSVGVSSGPDGEFVFAVEHDASVALRDVIPGLPGFAARVTGEGDGQLAVAAQDPEAES